MQILGCLRKCPDRGNFSTPFYAGFHKLSAFFESDIFGEPSLVSQLITEWISVPFEISPSKFCSLNIFTYL